MDFKRLRLSGFKSFVEAAELRIEPGLTGVVGPNGCGKSNLLEALRWVMGEGSPKSLRGAGMEDVIFAGTARRPARDIADVILTLESGEDTTEVVRRIERGAGSAYRINGRDVRQRDVQLLFADAATGAHSPALVSQGRIGAIIAAKPAERRALLEEAAGIAGLHVRRQEAELRLRATDANLARLDDVLQGLTGQANALRRAAKAAERYRALAARIRTAEAQLLYARWTAANAAAAAARAAAEAADSAVADASQRTATLLAEHAVAAEALPAVRSSEVAAAGRVQQLRAAADQLTTVLAQVEQRQRELSAAHDGIRRDRQHEAAVADDAAAALARLAAEASALADADAAATAALPGAAVATLAAEAAASEGERALSLAVEGHAVAAAEARALAIALAAAVASVTRAEAEATRLHQELVCLDANAEPDARPAAAATLAAAIQAAGAATALIAAAEAARRDGEDKRTAADARVRSARGSLAALTAEHDALHRQQAAAAGPVSVIIDQLSVASGYEEALAAALGDDLNAAVGGDSGRFWMITDPAAETCPDRSITGFDAGALDPALPDSVTPLLDHITAPATLHRRLRQVGIVDAVVAAALALQLRPGQRLVTVSGQLWRWDGFRALGGPAATASHASADHLRRRNRLTAITAELPPLQAELAVASADLAAAEAVLRTAADDERRARADRAAADRAQDTARAAQRTADAELARRASRSETLTAGLARAEADAAAARLNANRAREIAPDTALATLAAAVTSARAAVEHARLDFAAARAAQAGLTRDRDAAASRQAAVAAGVSRWTARHAASLAHAADLDTRASALDAEAAALAVRPAAIAARQRELATVIAAAEAERQTAAAALAAAEADTRDLDRAARAAAETFAAAREARARAAITAEHDTERRRDIEALSSERFAMPPPRLAAAFRFDSGWLDAATSSDPNALDTAALAQRFDALTAERDRLGPVNLRADTELAELEATIAASTAERTELDTAIAKLRGSIGALNREGRVRLLEAFTRVDGHFRELYATLFAGGAAHLELVEADDPLQAGLEIMAQPPGKKLQSLTLLSGGEQALTAIALIFALFLTTPSPLCVLDEVDAPLDDANVERFCDLLDHIADRTATRFLIVTHNAVTMSRMLRLYGVTMSEPGVSQLVSVDLARAELLAAA